MSEDLEKRLVAFADIAEAGGKPHWAKAMRQAAQRLEEPNDELARLRSENEALSQDLHVMTEQAKHNAEECNALRQDIERQVQAAGDLATECAALARDALEALMGEISEDCWCAGWMSGLELALWEAVVKGGMDYGQGEITAEQAQRLKRLSELAGGWCAWNDDTGAMFTPMDKWLEAYAAALKEGAAK